MLVFRVISAISRNNRSAGKLARVAATLRLTGTGPFDQPTSNHCPTPASRDWHHAQRCHARRRVALELVMLPGRAATAEWPRAGCQRRCRDRVGLGRPVRDSVHVALALPPDAVPPLPPLPPTPCRRAALAALAVRRCRLCRRWPCRRCRLCAAGRAAASALPPLAVPPIAATAAAPSLPVRRMRSSCCTPLVLPPLVVPAIGMSVEPAVLDPDVPFYDAAHTRDRHPSRRCLTKPRERAILSRMAHASASMPRDDGEAGECWRMP